MNRTVMILVACVPAILPVPSPASAAEPLPDFRTSAFFGERTREDRAPEGIRSIINLPRDFDPKRPTLLIVYATPNGNTIEQTLGCEPAPGLDWHFNIQHIAAQTRRLRSLDTGRNIVLAVVEADGLSWPAWRAKRKDNPALIATFVERTAANFGDGTRIALTGHSGGGSFIFGYLNANERIPDRVERIAFLDANYGYSDADSHGDRLIAWLRGGSDRRLVVLAYDDRNITVDGKPVVGPTGGTWRASHRMLDRFAKEDRVAASVHGELERHAALGGRAQLLLDRNPGNKILHTVLVETNGFLKSMTLGTRMERRAGEYRGKASYAKWIQPPPVTLSTAARAATRIPARPTGARPGSAVIESVAGLPVEEREAALVAEVLGGNVPSFLRHFRTLEASSVEPNGKRHRVRFQVMPDYLAVGSDEDFVRIPLTPMAAARVARAFDATLPTRRISDLVWQAAQVRLDPRPLTEAREAASTFVQHDRIIRDQLVGRVPGHLTAGIKKDVVVTERLREKPRRVAIYGWHYRTGAPIQPLTIVHRDTYVDYSHGIRLVLREVEVDGRPMDLGNVLKDSRLCPLVSDEGPITWRLDEFDRPQARGPDR